MSNYIPRDEWLALYKRPEWQKKRLEILEYAAWQCQGCGSGEKMLHVHHSKYIPGNKPWEYPNGWLTAMCDECHAKLHNKFPAPDISLLAPALRNPPEVPSAAALLHDKTNPALASLWRDVLDYAREHQRFWYTAIAMGWLEKTEDVSERRTNENCTPLLTEAVIVYDNPIGLEAATVQLPFLEKAFRKFSNVTSVSVRLA